MRFYIVKKQAFIIALTLLVAVVMGLYEIAVKDSSSLYAAANQGDRLPIFCVQQGQKKVGVTFNVAWDNTDVGPLLEILKRHNVTITFFIVGEFIDQYPDVVKQIAAAGHEIGNHSDKHPHVAQIGKEAIVADLKACEEKITALTGQKPTLYRTPYGEFSPSVVEAVQSSGYQCIQWNIDSVDWKDPPAGEITQRVLGKLVDGSIILFHAGKQNTVDALDAILTGIEQKGFATVPLSQMVLKENYTLDPAGCQIPGKK